MTQAVIDLKSNASDTIAAALNQCLAETAVTTMLAQNFHWNVTGMAFNPLHELFQKIYEDHFQAQDELAERVRALDAHAHGTLSGMVARSKVAEHDGRADAKAMIKAMQEAQETLAATMTATAQTSARHGDSLTEDLCISRGRTHEKFAWFLRSHLA